MFTKMTSHNSLLHCSSGGGTGFPRSAFSAFNFLRNYNYLLQPEPTEPLQKHLPTLCNFPEFPSQSPNSEQLSPTSCLDKPFITIPQTAFVASNNFLGYSHHSPIFQTDLINTRSTVLSPRSPVLSNAFKRQRGEKKPIPADQKDEKYFERRRRNNQAAKKSRDARKLREDQVALKAAILEHENAVLRAQLLTVREELSSLRQLLMEKKISEYQSKENRHSRS